MIYSDNTFDITNNIATYTRRDFKSVFDSTSNKWYMLNNLDNYEEYGIYGDSFDTYYQGKLVIVNNHEYEWDGAEWDDLGTNITIATSVYRDSTHTGYIKFPYTTSEVSSIEVTFKQNTTDTNFLIATGATNTNRWRVFYGGGTKLMYDAGDTRWQATGSEYFNKKLHLRFDGNPMRLYNYDTQTYLYTGTSIRPTGRNFYWGYYELDWEGTGISNTPGWLYDDVILYSDNGVTAIAHYIPYIQNGVAGLYDIMNESFLAPIGLLGAETTTRRPKDYPEKTAPTISTLWASTIYRNSAHLTTFMRNDAEIAKMDYMSDDILKKGEVPLPIDYLCFEANTSGSTIALSNTNISPNIEYSRDKNTWTTWNYSALTLQNVGDKIYMRGSNPNGIGLTEANVSKFVMTGSISASGNIMTLIDKVGETLIIPSDYCFRNLFRGCTSLVEANISFPATTLTNYCYDNIFRDCTNLSKAPVLVATNANYTSCYRSMFNKCNALNKIITYAQTIGANSTESWLDQVAATGDFYNLGGATYSSGASGIPTGWTVHTSL